MRCGACGTELIAGKPFCHACGARVALTCRGCGASIEAEFRFCPDCGLEVSRDVHDAVPPPVDDPLARLSERIPTTLAHKIRASRGVIEGERKLVTVLFCDLADSTAIAERLDPEEYHDLLDQYLELAFGEIYRLEGIVNQLAGDGMMALFGAPVAHEDAPQRAVHAALAIHEALARFAPPILAAKGLALRARIGINTGPVVVGTVGNDLKMDYTAIGDTTNLAARLEAMATPGSTLVSETTYRLVRGFFRMRPPLPLEVKGKREPVVAYGVLGVAEATTPMAIAVERGLTPLVGRGEELAQLEACYRRLGERLGQVAAVVGRAGSGKSRLIHEFRRRLAGEAALVLEGRCSTLGQTVPYAPFVTMFRQYFDLAPGETPESARAKVAAKVSAWGEKPGLLDRLVARLLSLPLTKGAAETEGEELRRESFDAVAQLLLAESERAPVVMIIEDLHWVDDASRELLESLAARLANARVLIVVSQRPEDHAGWRAPGAFTQIVLRPLGDDEVREMIRAVAGGAVPPELESLLVAKAEGSPFFAEEITRALVEEGYLVRDNGRRRLTRPLEDIRIPGTVQEVLAARLDRLGAHAKRVVQVAAVLGRQFRGRQLAAVLDGEGIDVARELTELERRGLFHRKSLLASDEYRFGESLTQEVAYEGLLLKQRRQLHERVAVLLEAGSEEMSAERTAMLAHHYSHSDNRPKAIEALLRAGREAERLPSYRAAVDFYRRAWELLEAALAEGADGAVRRAALEATVGISRLTVLFGLPFLAEAERAATRGRELAESLGDAESLGALYYYQGVLSMARGREGFARGLELAERGVAVTEAAGLPLATMRILRGLSVNYVLDGRFALALEKSAWVLGELERSGHRERLTDVYMGGRWTRDVVLYLSDELDAAEASATETYELALGAANRTVMSAAASTLAQIHFMRGSYANARHWADLALETGEAIGNLVVFPTAAAVALTARLELGEEAAPERWVKRIEQGFSASGNAYLNSRFVADALLAAGDLARAERYAEQLGTNVGGRLREALASLALGEVSARLGRAAEAARHYREAIAIAEAIGARSAFAIAVLGAAEAARAGAGAAPSAAEAARALEICRALRLGRYAPRIARLCPQAARTAAGPA